MEKKVFAIHSLELVNNEYIQKYCYRPPRNSFVQRAIDSIPSKNVETNEANNEGEQVQENPVDVAEEVQNEPDNVPADR